MSDKDIGPVFKWDIGKGAMKMEGTEAFMRAWWSDFDERVATGNIVRGEQIGVKNEDA